jgi:hypothetical protein
VPDIHDLKSIEGSIPSMLFLPGIKMKQITKTYSRSYEIKYVGANLVFAQLGDHKDHPYENTYSIRVCDHKDHPYSD